MGCTRTARQPLGEKGDSVHSHKPLVQRSTETREITKLINQEHDFPIYHSVMDGKFAYPPTMRSLS